MPIRKFLLVIRGAIADFLYPPSCLLCGNAAGENDCVCPECFAALAETARLHEPPPKMPEHISRLFVLLPYDRNCRTLVHGFKYHGIPSLAVMAGRLMAKKALSSLAEFSNAPLAPVPLHPEKLRKRGYNQCRFLAEGFSSFSGHAIREDLLERTADAGTQTALDVESRKRNVRGAFQYAGETSLKGSPIILIDDVTTTGATLSECARALKDGGAGDIAGCVAAVPGLIDD